LAGARCALKTAVASCCAAAASGAGAPSGEAQFGQNLKSALAIGVPHLGHGGTDVATTGLPSLAPQKAQKGCVLSTACPHELHIMSAAPAAAWTTRVAGTPATAAAPPAAPTAIAGAPATAEARSGLPQSMQNREPSSLLRPQCSQVVTCRKAPAWVFGNSNGWRIYGLIGTSVN
jgi:hypothetical protein